MSTNTPTQEKQLGKVPIFPVISASAGVIGPPLVMIVITIDGFLRPGYSAIRQQGSDLGVGWQYAWIQNLNVTIYGFLLMVFAVGFYGRMEGLLSQRRLRLVSILLVLAGVGGPIAGIFTESYPIGHGIGATLIFDFPPIAQFFTGRKLRTTPSWQGYGKYSMINGVLGMAYIVFAMFYPILKIAPSLVTVESLLETQIGGVLQRIGMIIIWNWYVVSGWRFLSLGRQNIEYKQI